jgi:adenylate cyclase
VQCPKCGYKNPAGAKFCNQCGAELYVVRRKRDRGQRRRVAVLFTDISGFTSLSENLDPEDVRDLIDSCLQRLADIVYKYEGYIDKFIGDCIMALFGAPVIHEDDPLRAAIVALEQLKEIKRFNKEKELKLSLSIGINYGLVATGDLGRPGEYTVMGDVVNLAQRLQYAAPRGKIYASETIYKNTRDEIQYKKLKKIKVKGKREPVSVFETQKVKRQYSLRKIRELPMIGRRYELKELFKLFGEVRKGSGRVVSIIGEAGIGKSKLVYEFKKQLDKEVYQIEGRGIEYLSSSSYLVLKDIVKSLLRIDEKDSKESAAKKVTKFIQETHYSSLVKLVPFLKYFLGLTLSRDDINRFESMKPKDRIRLINEAILSLLLRISHIKPLVITFEDCHWIDAETVGFMDKLVGEISQKQIMVINLYRPEFSIGKQTSKLDYFSRINLKPLAADDTITLLYDLLRCKKIEDKLIQLLIKKSGRIPFYIHELTNNLLNNNIIFVDADVAKLKHGMESAVPRTLDELVMAKVDRLDNVLRMIVDIASVIGDEFSIKLLDTLLELGDDLRTNLSLLIQKGIFLPLKSIEGDISTEEKYTFSHSLMREAVYESLLKRMRREYHRQIGHAIELVYSDSIDEYFDALANHFLMGGEKIKAVEYLEKAADHKKDLYLNNEAIELYKKAIDLLDKSQQVKIATIYEKLGSIYRLIGEYDEALNNYSKMGHYGKNDALLWARHHINVADLFKNQGLFDKALIRLNKARTILKGMKKSSSELKMQLANILSLECWFYRIKGKMNEAENKAIDAISLIKGVRDWRDYKNLKRALAKAYTNLAIVYVIKGEYDKAIDLCEDTVLIAEELGDRVGLGSTYNILGTIYRSQAKYDQTIDAYTMKLKISQELGDKSGVGIAYCNLGIVYQNKGEHEKAIGLLEHYLNISEELGDKHGIGQAYVNLGVVYWLKNEYDRAIKSFEKYLMISEELGDKRGIAVASGNLGEVYESRLEHKKAISLFNKHLTMSTALGDKGGIGMASLNLGAAYVAVNKLSEAEEYLHSAVEIFRTIGNKVTLATAYVSLAALRLRQNRLTDARSEVDQAMKLAKETDSHDLQIKAFINMGRINIKDNRARTKKEARQFFIEAIKLAKASKNKILLADAYFEFANTVRKDDKSERNLARKNYNAALKIYKKLKLTKRIDKIRKIIGSKK